MTERDDIYNRILSEGPSSETFFLVLSRMREEGSLKRVIQECIRATGMYPSDLRLRYLLAEACLEAGFFTRAEAELEQVTSRINDLCTAFRLQADLYRRQKRWKEAVEAMQKYLAIRPEDAEASRIMQELASPEETIVTEVPPPLPAGIPVEFIEREERAPEALEAEAFPDLATPTLAEVYVEQGLLQDAIAVYEKVVSRDPEAQAPRHRLEELKAMVPSVPLPPREEEAGQEEEKNRRMISILESWRARMREMSQSAVAP